MLQRTVASTRDPEVSILVIGVDVNKSIRQSLGDSVFWRDSSSYIVDEMDIPKKVGYIFLGNTVTPSESRRITGIADTTGRKITVESGVIPADISTKVQRLIDETGGKNEMANANGNGGGESLTDLVRKALKGRDPNALTSEDRQEIIDSLLRESNRSISGQQLSNALTPIRKERVSRKTRPSPIPRTKHKMAKRPRPDCTRETRSSGVSEIVQELDAWLAQGQEIRDRIAATEDARKVIQAVTETLEQFQLRK